MIRKQPSIHGLIAGAMLLIVTLACGPRGGETPTAIPTAAPLADVTQTATPLAPQITLTPAPDVTTAAGCTLNGAFAGDVTAPDNTQFPPGTGFTKTWRVRNSGTCTWEAGATLVFISGEQMSGPASVLIGGLPPDATADVSVTQIAPTAPGTYTGNWQFQAPDGTRFGQILYVKIVVPAPATPTPTATPAPTATPTSGCAVVNGTLAPILTLAQSLGYDLGCATAPAASTNGALQEFWANVDDPNPHTHSRSLMIWRSDNKDIYVIVGQNTDASQGGLLAYTDFWTEGMPNIPDACVEFLAPQGYQAPIRGFGKLWCENHLWDSVGWPAQPEAAATVLVQPMQTGLLLKVSAPPSAYLVALDYRAVWAVTTMTTP